MHNIATACQLPQAHMKLTSLQDTHCISEEVEKKHLQQNLGERPHAFKIDPGHSFCTVHL